MAIRITVGPVGTRVRDTSPREPAMTVGEVAQAFDAHAMAIDMGSDDSPLWLFAVREQVVRRLRSPGGRTARHAAVATLQVPMSEHDIRLVERLAARAGGDGPNPSPAQVAAVILRLALERLPAADIQIAVRAIRTPEA